MEYWKLFKRFNIKKSIGLILRAAESAEFFPPVLATIRHEKKFMIPYRTFVSSIQKDKDYLTCSPKH